MYLAHKAPDGRQQSVSQHAEGTAALARRFAAPFGMAELAEAAALAHDLGKCTAGFQRRLEGGPRVDHASAGARWLWEHRMLMAAFCVCGHHGGLPDGGTALDREDGTLFARCRKPPAEQARWEGEVSPLSLPEPSLVPLDFAFSTRMLFSCLVDADYLDTEAFMQSSAIPRGGYDSLDVLWQRLHDHFLKKGFLQEQTPGTLNARRSEILRTCIGRGADAPGLFSLTVPTGGGKTLASLAFALRHALHHGKQRILYVIPYTSIIEQTAAVFSSILGEENVVQHHSAANFAGDDDSVDPGEQRRRLATENWDAPIIVTTSVQFFESLYGNRPSCCRKLHNIAQSVIIFDEAQMMPLPYLLPCVSAIAELVQHFGATAVLCTATQPALAPFFQQLAPGILPREICPNTEVLFAELRRVTFQSLGGIDAAALAARLDAAEQVLCIVNTRRDAQEVFHALHGAGNYHLSTLMPPLRRLEVLEEIRARLKVGAPCRVVSTSLIEAGVDVDFPTVYRAEAGLDSILQAAGRCNRENKRSPQESCVFIFRLSIPPMLRPQAESMARTLRRCNAFDTPKAIETYFKLLYHQKGQAALDRQEILSTLGDSEELPSFAEAASRFHLIDSDTRTVYLFFDEKGEALRRQLLQGEWSCTLFRAIQRYAVNVYPRHYQELLDCAALQPIDEQSAILVRQELYDAATGLSLRGDDGQALFI